IRSDKAPFIVAIDVAARELGCSMVKVVEDTVVISIENLVVSAIFQQFFDLKINL
ncbi:hypothetical protein KQX54_000089, partial [Cotesia glomerata]